MKKTEKAVLIEGLRKLSADVLALAAALEGKQPEAPPEPEKEEEAPAKVFSFEDARAILAEKARVGYKAEVKALLTSHGVSKLSEITDPAELATVVQEAEGIGNG